MCGEGGVGLSAVQKRELMNDALYPFVVEVRFELRKLNNTLKHPVILRIRDDKRPEECIFPLHLLRAA